MLIILKKAGSIGLLRHCNIKNYGLRYKDLCIIVTTVSSQSWLNQNSVVV